MIRFTAQTAMVCILALSAAGCAVEMPMSAFRLAPPDAAQKTDAHSQRHQDVKHISVP
jgi:uncharacterized lipoprotein YmbA